MIKFDSSTAAAVDREYYWRPIEGCPLGVKVQLINKAHGTAVYGVMHAKNQFWTHWAPLPVFRKD